MYLEKFSLSGRTALITGGGRGIGFACAQALGEAGARIIIADADPTVADAAASLAAQGIDAHSHLLDVTDVDAVVAAASQLNQHFGAVDTLVCNAGIVRSGIAAETMSNEDWRLVVDVNLNGVFWCCREFGRAMLGRGFGAIVNIGSMSGQIANKPQEQASYNAAKAGVHHLTRSLAAEWAARGVRVNAVAPTYIDTPLTRFGMDDPKLSSVWLEMTPMHRVGRPDEIASVVLFLASEASSLMTGSIVLADAGYTCW